MTELTRIESKLPESKKSPLPPLPPKRKRKKTKKRQLQLESKRQEAQQLILDISRLITDEPMCAAVQRAIQSIYDSLSKQPHSFSVCYKHRPSRQPNNGPEYRIIGTSEAVSELSELLKRAGINLELFEEQGKGAASKKRKVLVIPKNTAASFISEVNKISQDTGAEAKAKSDITLAADSDGYFHFVSQGGNQYRFHYQNLVMQKYIGEKWEEVHVPRESCCRLFPGLTKWELPLSQLPFSISIDTNGKIYEILGPGGDKFVISCAEFDSAVSVPIFQIDEKETEYDELRDEFRFWAYAESAEADMTAMPVVRFNAGLLYECLWNRKNGKLVRRLCSDNDMTKRDRWMQIEFPGDMSKFRLPSSAKKSLKDKKRGLEQKITKLRGLKKKCEHECKQALYKPLRLLYWRYKKEKFSQEIEEFQKRKHQLSEIMRAGEKLRMRVRSGGFEDLKEKPTATLQDNCFQISIEMEEYDYKAGQCRDRQAYEYKISVEHRRLFGAERGGNTEAERFAKALEIAEFLTEARGIPFDRIKLSADRQSLWQAAYYLRRCHANDNLGDISSQEAIGEEIAGILIAQRASENSCLRKYAASLEKEYAKLYSGIGYNGGNNTFINTVRSRLNAKYEGIFFKNPFRKKPIIRPEVKDSKSAFSCNCCN